MKPLYSHVLIFAFLSSFLSAQVQIGETIYANSLNEKFGTELELSYDGKRLLVASPFNKVNYNSEGSIRLLDEHDGEWQTTFELTGNQENVKLGHVISLSSDGDRFAVKGYNSEHPKGFINVYEEQNGDFYQLGDTLFSPDNLASFAHDLKLVLDGNRLVVASRTVGDLGVGFVEFYDLKENLWELQPMTIYGKGGALTYAESIDVSADGETIIIPELDFSEVLNRGGAATVYKLKENNWEQLGQVILGDEIAEQLGFVVKISDDGNTVAITSKRNDFGKETYSSKVDGFMLIEDEWVKMGNSIIGTKDLSSIGLAMDLSADGRHIIIGEKEYGELYYSGKAIHYSFDESNQWIQSEVSLFGDGIHDNLGKAVTISGEGIRFAAGAPRSSGESYVKAYGIDVVNAISYDPSITMEAFPNPNNGSFYISSSLENRNLTLRVVNDLGVTVYEKKNFQQSTQLNVDLNTGIYFVLLTNGNEFSQRKIFIID